MPQEQEQFQKTVDQVLEAVMFENWLRFYFISEKPDAPAHEDGEAPLFMAVPVKGMERISELYPHLLPLADAMNARKWILKPRARPSATLYWNRWTARPYRATLQA